MLINSDITIKSQLNYRIWAEEQRLPLRLQPSWWDKVYGSRNWSAVVVKVQNKVVAAQPYALVKKSFFTFVEQKPLDTYAQVWIDPLVLGGAEVKSERLIGNTHKWTAAILKEMPAADRIKLRLHPTITNGLPWLWAGYKLSTCFTYRLNIASTETELWANLRHHLRSDIRKAEKLCIPQISSFRKSHIVLLQSHFALKKQALPYSLEALQRFAASDGPLLCFEAKANGTLVAYVAVAKDAQEAYLLFQAIAPGASSSQALQLCLWRALLFCADQGCQTFDFEGSMIPSVEHQLRAWGGQPSAYFLATRTNHFLLKLATVFKQ